MTKYGPNEIVVNGSIRLLMVGNNHEDATLIQLALRDAEGQSLDVTRAKSVSEAEALLSRQTFDIALLDLSLPDCNGLSGLGQIQSFCPQLPVVVLTGELDVQTGAEALRQGAQDYLTKSQVDAGGISKAIRYAIERKHLTEALQRAHDEIELRVRERTTELRKTVEAAAAERQRFMDVLNMLPAYVVLLTTDYHVPFANRLFRDRFGASNGKRCYEYLFNRTEPCETCESFTVAKTHAPHHWEWTGPDNRNYDVHDFPFSDTDGTPLILEMGIDITERRKAEAELSVYREDLERLVDERTLKLEEVNDALQAEIAERKAAQEGLARERANLQAVFEAVNVGMLLIDEAGAVRRVNSTLARWVQGALPAHEGNQPGDFLGCIHALADPEGCGQTVHCSSCGIRNTFETVLSTQRPLHDVEAEASLSVDGKEVALWLEINADPLVLDGKRHVILAVNNITARKQAEEALRQSEERFRIAQDLSLDAFAIFSAVRDDRANVVDFRWEYANPEAGRMLLRSPEYLVGRRLLDVLPGSKFESGLFDSYVRVIETGRPDDLELPYDADGIHGWYRYMTVRLGDGVAAYSTDITERKARERNLIQLNRTLRAHSHSNQAQMRAMEESAYMQEVCTIIVEDCGHAMVWIGLAENDEGKSVRPVASAGFEEGYLDSLKITWADVDRGRGPTGTAIRTGKPSMCANMLTDPKFAPWRENALRRGYASSLVLPLMNTGKPFGAICVYSREPNAFSEDEIQLLSELADDLAFGIASLRVREAHTQAMASLARGEERYRTLFNGMTEGFALHEIITNEHGEPRDYRFLEVNPAFERLTGMKADSVVGRTFNEVMHGEKADWVTTYGKVALTGEPIHFQDYSDALDRWYEVFSYRPAPGQFAAVFMDVTERKRIEKQLEILSRFPAENPNPVMRIDREGTLLYCNPAGQHILAHWRCTVGSQVPREIGEIAAKAMADGEVSEAELSVGERTLLMAFAPIAEFGYQNVYGGDITERKRAEEALKRSRDRFELLAETIGALLQSSDPKELVQDLCWRVMRYLDCQAFFNFLVDDEGGRLRLNAYAGIPEEEAIRIEWLDFGVAVCGCAAASGCRIVAEHIPTTPDPRTDLVRSYGIKAYACHPLLGPNNKVIGTLSFGAGNRETFNADDLALMKSVADHVAVAMERVHSERELRRAHDELEQRVEERTAELRGVSLYARSLIEASLDPLVTISPEGQITDVNVATEEATGVSSLDLIESDFADYFTEPEKAREVYRRVLAEGQVRDYPLTMCHTSGSTMDVLYNATIYTNDAGEIQGVFAAARDNTQRKRFEDALRNSQARLAEAQRIAHLGGWDWDITTNEIDWSDEMYRIFGLAPQSVTIPYELFLERVHPEDQARVDESVKRALQGIEAYDLTYRIVLPDETVKIVHAQGEITFNASGKPVRMLGTVLDITERVRAEEEAKLRQQQLVQADKMVSLGILVSGVAHEINNPNHSIMANVGALKGVWEDVQPILDAFHRDFGDFVLGGYDYSESRDTFPDMFRSALASSQRIELIVTELRDFARYDPKEKMTPIEIDAVVESAVVLISNLIHKSTDRFSVEHTLPLPPVIGNRQRIEQVVINLIQNACQSLRCREDSIAVRTSFDPNSDAVVIEVSDEGSGISEEDLRHLGDPFFTTKRPSSGTGLGLWVSFNIVHEHGGSLTFSSGKGRGTRAIFSLPAIEQKPPFEDERQGRESKV